MARPVPKGRNKQHIEAHIETSKFRPFHDKRLEGARDAAFLFRADSFRCLSDSRPGLDFNSDKHVVSPGNDIYFAEGLAIAAGDNMITFQPKCARRKEFSRATPKIRAAAFSFQRFFREMCQNVAP